MDLKTHLQTLSAEEKRQLAASIGTKVIYLIQIAGRHASPSGKMCLAIERATGGKVTRHELRPDLYPIEPYTSPSGNPEAETAQATGIAQREPPPVAEAARQEAA